MKDWIMAAKQRKEELEHLIRYLESGKKECPEGKIRINHHNKKVQYYLQTGGRKGKRKYLRKDQTHIACQILQREHDLKLLRVAREELACIGVMMKKMPQIQAEEVFESFSKERRKLIIPWKVPDDTFIEDWESFSYEKKGFFEDSPEYLTAKGERVRSKSEILIADTLGRYGIPYRYECPLILNGRKIHPDFTVLHVPDRKEIIWEHLGMMDSIEYVENALFRVAEYEKEGYLLGKNLILTWETNRSPLSTRVIQNYIEAYLR